MAVAILGGLLALAPAQAAPPANDDWESAQQVSLPFSAEVDLSEASAQFGERSCIWGDPETNPSVWFKVSAPSSSRMVARAFSASIATQVGIFSGPALKDFISHGCNYSSQGYQTRVTWVPTAGQTYYIRVAGFHNYGSSSRGVLQFDVSIPPVPVNDEIQNAKTISYAEPLEYEDLSEENASAGSQGEPRPSCWFSGDAPPTVWYTFTTPDEVSKDFVLHAIGAWGVHVTLWKQLNDQFTEVACATSDPVRITPEVNTTYYIQVTERWRNGDAMGLHLHATLPGDNLDEAIEVPEIPFVYEQDAYNATTELGEKRPSCLTSRRGSVWFRYTAATETVISISSKSEGTLQAWAAAYRGPTPSSLQELACFSPDYRASSSGNAVEVRPGETIYIQAGYYYSNSSMLRLSLTALAPAVNDSPATARDVSSATSSNITITQSSVPARLSAGEPAPSCAVDPGSTVWFSFTPMTDQTVNFETSGTNYDTAIAIYGADMNELDCNDDVGSNIHSRVKRDLKGGQTYLISVSGNNRSRSSTLYLRVRPAGPPNDDFAQAHTIASTPFADARTTTFATLESQEPQPSADCIGSSAPASIAFTIWYRFTPPEDMSLTASTLGNNLQTLVAVYEGTSFSDLVQVACSGPRDIVPPTLSPRVQLATFEARAGKTYYFQVGHRATAGQTMVPFELTRTDGAAL